MREQNYGEITELNSKQHILWIEHLRAISIIGRHCKTRSVNSTGSISTT